MPTIQQLPSASSVGSADEIPVSQLGVTNAVSVGALLSSTQPAILAPTGTLLGRNSLGPGGPETVNIGTGLQLVAGTLVATGTVAAAGVALESLTMLPVVTSIAAPDLIAVNQNGTNAAISYTNLLDGETIDEATPAAPAGDTDAFWVSQGSSTLVRQTFAAVWSWLTPKLPMYRLPVVELITNTTLDGTVHNGRILVCSQPLTLASAFINMGSGFFCELLNLSTGKVALGGGITVLSGSSTVGPNQMVLLRAVSYSGGNIVVALTIGSTAAGQTPSPSLPGQVVNLTADPTTSSSVGLTWATPVSGGVPTGYTVQYEVAGSSSWSTFESNITATAIAVTGLSAATTYNFQVIAVNSAGSGAPSGDVSQSTAAATASVSSITWNVGPASTYNSGSGAIALNVHVAPSTSPVQLGVSTSSTVRPTSWIAASLVNSDLWGAYVPIPSAAGTYFAWAEGTDGSSPTVFPTAFTVT